jgi:hypothetical protein
VSSKGREDESCFDEDEVQKGEREGPEENWREGEDGEVDIETEDEIVEWNPGGDARRGGAERGEEERGLEDLGAGIDVVEVFKGETEEG